MPSIKLPPSEAIDDLYRAILSLRGEDECHLFFSDLAAVNQQLYHHACQHKPAIRYRRLSAHS